MTHGPRLAFIPRGMRSRLRVGAAIVGWAIVALACNSPTIPIPPLHAPSFQLRGMDQWIASGDGATPRSEVFLIDRTTGDGVTSRADDGGGFSTGVFAGRAGDTIELFYRTPTGELSPSVCSPLGEGTPGATSCP
jgi:hypothetical protein